MFDDFSKRSKAVRAALELAKDRAWGDITLADIAQAANLNLADLRREFSCKTDLIRAFQSEVDAEVLAKARSAGEGQSARDRLFDIVMTRFEVMAPYKPALRRISNDLCRHPAEATQLLPSSLASQYWMLAGAGAKLDPGTAFRVAGLASIYARVFRVWLDDDSPGLDRTMAALDRRLKAGEEWLSSAERACESLCRLACGFMPRGWKRRGAGDTAASPAAGSTSANPAGA
jgi:AcrR family transcriptional regulator